MMQLSVKQSRSYHFIGDYFRVTAHPEVFMT